MKSMPLRDITGECHGECRDRIREGEDLRQKSIDESSIDYAEYASNLSWTFSRDLPPGALGGRV